MDAKKIIAFMAMAAGSWLLFSSFTTKKSDQDQTDTVDTGGASLDDYVTSEDPAPDPVSTIPNVAATMPPPTWENTKLIVFLNKVTGKYMGGERKTGGITVKIESYPEIYAYSVTKQKFVTSEGLLPLGTSSLGLTVPDFIVNGTNLTLAHGKTLICMQQEPAHWFTDEGLFFASGQWAHEPYFYMSRLNSRPKSIPSSFLTYSKQLVPVTSGMMVYGYQMAKGTYNAWVSGQYRDITSVYNAYVITNKGIILTYHSDRNQVIPEKNRVLNGLGGFHVSR